MVDLGGQEAVLAAAAVVVQPQHEVRVLVPPTGKSLVESVHRLEVLPGQREVAAADAFPAKTRLDAPWCTGPVQQVRQLVHVAGHPQPQPAGRIQLGQIHSAIERGPGERRAQQHPAAVDEAAGLREQRVLPRELRVGHAVAVEEDQVVRLGMGGAEVARARRREADVRVPHVPHRAGEARQAAPHRVHVLRPRAVVGDHHDVLARALRRQRAQHGQQRVGPVVRQDDEGRLHRPPRACRCSSHSLR